MKKTLIALGVCMAAVSSFAQGTIAFNNNTTASPVTIDGALAPTTANVRVALYYAVNTSAAAPAITPQLTGWTQATPVTADPLAAPGRFVGGTQTAELAAGGANVWALVVGWAGPVAYNDWASAYAAALNDASVLVAMGTSAFIQGTGNPNQLPTPGTPAALVNGVNGFTGLALAPLSVVPEPSTFALAGLGLAGLLIFRRRK